MLQWRNLQKEVALEKGVEVVKVYLLLGMRYQLKIFQKIRPFPFVIKTLRRMSMFRRRGDNWYYKCFYRQSGFYSTNHFVFEEISWSWSDSICLSISSSSQSSYCFHYSHGGQKRKYWCFLHPLLVSWWLVTSMTC